MVISLEEMHQEAWPSNHLKQVDYNERYELISEMLTPVDEPLDKLDDLTPSEMYVHPRGVC